jgi:hypothetical protein
VDLASKREPSVLSGFTTSATLWAQSRSFTMQLRPGKPVKAMSYYALVRVPEFFPIPFFHLRRVPMLRNQDGGGIRSYSSLLILEELLKLAQETDNSGCGERGNVGLSHPCP